MFDRHPGRRGALGRLLVTCIAVAGAAGVAHASPRVVPLVPDIHPPAPPLLRDRFHDSVAKGMPPDVDTVPASDIRSRPGASDCHGGPCTEDVASSTHADLVVATAIEQAGKQYTVRVRVFDGRGHEVGKPLEDHCDICTIREVDETVQKAVRRAVSAASTSVPPPAVAKAPPATGAPDDEGTGAPRTEAGRKEHRGSGSAATSASGATERRSRGAGGEGRASRGGERGTSLGARGEAHATLEPRAPEPRPTPAEPRPTVVERRPPERAAVPPRATDARMGGDVDLRPYRSMAIAAFAVGGASLIATVAFGVYAAREGDPSCGRPDPRHTCPEIYAGNTTPTAVFGVLTGVSLGAGALLLYLDHRQRHPAPTVMVAPARGGAVAAAAFTF